MFEKELEEYKNQLKWKGKIFMTEEIQDDSVIAWKEIVYPKEI